MTTLGVVGAGVIGTGIATLARHRGLSVILLDTDPEVLRTAPRRVRQHLRSARMLRRIPGVEPTGELTTTTDVADLASADVVVEAVTERFEVKSEVLGAIAAAVPDTTAIVSNTSGFPVADLATAVAPEQQPRVAVVHFMNPPYLIDTVELVAGPATSDETVAGVLDLLTELGLTAIRVGDRPGFVANTLSHAYMLIAMRLIESDTASAADIDAIFTRCYGHATGPLATADIIGLDTVKLSADGIHERTGDPVYKPPALLVSMVDAGNLGRKSGHGFYDYNGPNGH